MELFPPLCNGCLQKCVEASQMRKMTWFVCNKETISFSSFVLLQVPISWIAGSNITTSNKDNWKYKRYAILIHCFNWGKHVHDQDRKMC